MKSAVRSTSKTVLKAHKQAAAKKAPVTNAESARTVLKLLRYPLKDQKRVDRLLRELD